MERPMLLRRIWSFALLALLLAALPAYARQRQTPPIAALTGGNIWLYNFDGSGQQFTNDELRYRFPTWSPDGRRFAVMAWGPNVSRHILMTDFSGAPLTRITNPLPSEEVPPSFSPDGSMLLFASNQTAASMQEIYRFTPVAGAALERIASYPLNACGIGGMFVPHERALNSERDDLYIEGYPGVLAVTPFGILHNTRCDAGDLWLLNPQNGQDFQLFERTNGVFIAPERTRAIAILNDTSVAFINTERGPYTQVTPAARPDQIGFGLPGSNEMFYSTRALKGATPLPEGVRQQFNNVFFTMPNSYETSIHRFSLRTGVDEVLYTADAYGLSRLTLTPDGGTLLFSQLPNPDAWVQAVAEGRLDAGDFEAAEAYMQVEVYALDLADKSVRMLGRGWNQFALNPTVNFTGASGFAAPTVAAPPPTATYPPTLAPGEAPPTTPQGGLRVGVTATISSQMTALNVRRNPGTGSAVVEITMGGTTVTIIEGPVDQEGYRWWKILLPSTAEGWVAETVNGIQTLEPN